MVILRRSLSLFLVLGLGAAASNPSFAQEAGKRPLDHDVYDVWRSIDGQRISDDGRHVLEDGGGVAEHDGSVPLGPGSLLEALEAKGPRIVVFEVGGVIDMQKTVGSADTVFSLQVRDLVLRSRRSAATTR
jgi:hypothetical protein